MFLVQGISLTGPQVAIFAGRVVNVYIFSFILNLGRAKKINFRFQHMLVFAGLRGAIAFALAIRNTQTEERQLIFTTTLVIVMVTVLFCGGLTTLALQCLRIQWVAAPVTCVGGSSKNCTLIIFIFQSIKVGVAFCYFNNMRYRFYLNHPHVLLNVISKEHGRPGFKCTAAISFPATSPGFCTQGFIQWGELFEWRFSSERWKDHAN